MQDTECTLFASPSESNDAELSEKHIDSCCISSSNEESCDEIERDAFLTTEMQMNTGGGNRALHYSDLNSPSNVSSAKMPKDNGRGHVALHYSHLYSHEADHSAEIQMDSGSGNICDPKEGDTFLDPVVEMQMNTGSGNCVLHYSDLNSPSNVSSAEMPKDNGHGHVVLHYSHLYSHESDHSAEIQMDSGSESESSSREDSVCDTQEQMIQSNQDQPKNLSLV